MSISELLKIVRQYHLSLGGQDVAAQGDAAPGAQGPAEDADLESSLSEAEMSSARWAWDWLRSRPQILINGNKRWNRLELSEVLALPEAAGGGAANPPASGEASETRQKKGQRPSNTLTTRPRIHPSEELVWQTLTRHGVDYKRVPALEWACLQGIASARAEGILQSDLRRLVNQDKRSLPKRTDSLARKGYIAKRTVVVQKMKTSRLWLIDFAPPLVEAETCGLDLSPETLSKDLEPVPWHERWTGSNIDMDALGRTAMGVVKAFNVIRYADLRSKMGVVGKRWQMKTLAKNCQRLVDMGVLKYTAASFPGSRKVFKDCLKFVREPSAEEWDKFLATGKKTSQYSDPTRHREPKPNALALYGKSTDDGQKGSHDRTKLKRIFSGWTPEKPLAQTVFEVIRSAGPEGASNPQVSVATVGYQHRRYLSSYLTKVAETQQPPHLKKFQIVSRLVRTGKTSAYMFSAPGAESTADATLPSQISDEARQPEQPGPAAGPVDSNVANPYGFGAVRPKVFADGQDLSLSALSKLARKSKPFSKRKMQPLARPEEQAETEVPPETTAEKGANVVDQVDQLPETGDAEQHRKRRFEETVDTTETVEDGAVEPPKDTQAPSERPTGAYIEAPRRDVPGKSLIVTFKSDKLKEFGVQLQVPSPTTISFTPANKANSFPGETGAALAQPPTHEEPTIEVAPPKSASARGKGRARGGARGRGRKGQGSSGGAKPYVCQTCGGSWKNDIGLKYHLEKAQVPCNPNFDPSTVLSRKRRRLSPARPPSSAISDAGAEETRSRLRPVRSTRKAEKNVPRPPLTVRRALRSVGDAAYRFRGLDVAEPGPAGAPPSPNPERARLVARYAASQRAMLTTARESRPEASTLVGATSSLAGQPNYLRARSWTSSSIRTSTPVATASYQPVAEARHVQEVNGGPAADAVRGYEQPKQLPPSLPTAPSTPSVPQAYSDVPATRDHIVDHSPTRTPFRELDVRSPMDRIPSPPYGRQGGPLSTEEFNVGASTGMSQHVYPEPPAQTPVGEDGQDAQQEQEVETWSSHDERPVIKPFVPSSNYRMSTDAKRRTAQAFDIINYLLDNNCGVFPGDKALFYAVTKVFLKEFRNQMPPTWKNCHSAVKALETRKQAVLHTHMLKTERGRLQTCTLLIRTGVDPNGLIPTVMKQKMRETYPGIYIPPAFSPTQEELALLQELDKKPPSQEKESKPNPNGQKFRSRRKYDEIEVFNAPYYTRSAPTVGVKKDPLWIRDSERFPGDSGNRKRPAADEHSSGPFQKRARTGIQGTPTGPTALKPADTYHDIPVDPDIMRSETDPASPLHGLTRQADDSQQGDAPGRQRKSKAASTSADDGSVSLEREPPSVIDAIKTYSLLPARLGGRGQQKSSPTSQSLGKLPPDLGRIRNPGLTSLPRAFFGNKRGKKIQSAPLEVQFLRPNTDLEDAVQVSEEEAQASSPASSTDPPQDAGLEEAQISTETEVDGPKNFRFISPSVLRDSSQGSWPALETDFFEHHDASFTLQGWMPSLKWLLTENLPSSVEEMVEKQNAEATQLRDWADRGYAKFCSLVNGCAAWEQSPSGSATMIGGAEAPRYKYINVSAPVTRANSRAVTLRWSDDTLFNLETLPYEDLEDDDYGDVNFVGDVAARRSAREPDSVHKKRRVQKAPVPQVRRAQGRPPKLKLHATKTMREHTAYPRTADDFLRVPGDEDEELDWSSENVRLAAFIVVTTLLGGVDRVVDWGLMLRLMPDQT